MKPLILTLLGAVVFAASIVTAEPLKLVSSSPQFWATNVNAATQKTISLGFDQPLRGTMTDWIGLDVLSPPSDLQTRYSPDRTSCSINVHLEPGRVYICALNERGIRGVGFQNQKAESLPPTYLVFQTAGTPQPNDAPPRLVRSIPAGNAQAVDAAKQNSITLVFDQPMNIKRHGLHLFEGSAPVELSSLRYSYSSDAKTLTVPYSFKPGTQYRLELNNIHDIGFSSANRVPMWPVTISFSTAAP